MWGLTENPRTTQTNESSQQENGLRQWMDSLGSALFCGDVAEFTQICDNHARIHARPKPQRMHHDAIASFSPAHPVKMPQSVTKLRVMNPNLPARAIDHGEVMPSPKTPLLPMSVPVNAADHTPKKVVGERLCVPKHDPLQRASNPHLGRGLVPLQGSPSQLVKQRQEKQEREVGKMDNPRTLPGSYVFLDPAADLRDGTVNGENIDDINGFGSTRANADLRKKIASIDLEDGFCFVSADIVEFGVANRQMEVV